MKTSYIYKILIIISMMICIVIMGVITNHDSIYNTNSNIANYQTNEKILEMKPLMVSARNISYYDIDHYTDLSVMNHVTVDDINHIITYWDSACGGSPFLNEGQIFIDASMETGLDPIYILAHAGLESAWGNSYFGTMYHNYFGIGAFDYDPDNAINYSNDNMREGIIEGAKWIKNNYYNTGQTSLYSMRYNNGYNEYCTSDTWVSSITSIIQTSYSLISS